MEVPEELRSIAKGLLCDLIDRQEESRVSGEPFWSSTETADIIARALLSERLAQKERGAKYLEAKATEMRTGSNVSDMMARIFEDQANAIRNQP
jgi:hypothetical protein